MAKRKRNAALPATHEGHTHDPASKKLKVIGTTSVPGGSIPTATMEKSQDMSSQGKEGPSSKLAQLKSLLREVLLESRASSKGSGPAASQAGDGPVDALLGQLSSLLGADSTSLEVQASKQAQNNAVVVGSEPKGTTGTDGLPPLPSINDPKLLEQVFTHQGSLAAGLNHRVDLSYERLEFLGDAYLECICSRFLCESLPSLPAGRLSQLRQALVNNKNLAVYARRYGFGERLRAPAFTVSPKHEEKTLADVFEAYVAAVIQGSSTPDHGAGRGGPPSWSAIEAGLTTADAWLRALWGPKLKESVDKLGAAVHVHAKQELAQKVMAPGVKLDYVEERPAEVGQGVDRDKATFFVGVYLTGWCWNRLHLGSGTGLSKVEAGNRAAAKALENRPLIDDLVTRKRAYDALAKPKD